MANECKEASSSSSVFFVKAELSASEMFIFSGKKRVLLIPSELRDS